LAVALVRVRRYITPRMFHQLHDLLHQWIGTWLGWVESSGYPGVIVLMAMESSIFPVPSEVVVPPAAIAAASGGKMTITGVILAGTFGSWLGSTITYWISLWVGRAVIARWGKYFFISTEKLERAERFMSRYEAGGIFFARLLPVIRHLISIPAGIIRMNFLKFSVMTIIGSAIWCSVLAWLGQRVGEKNPGLMQIPNEVQKAEALIAAIKAESHPIIIGVVLLCVLYGVAMKITAPKSTPAA
jgi:membrane protein DedA with SNARE-associated domain